MLTDDFLLVKGKVNPDSPAESFFLFSDAI
jgi:hypothetical protein